jgi:hypothetical protein
LKLSIFDSENLERPILHYIDDPKGAFEGELPSDKDK